MDAARKVYHRALSTPLEGIEALWHEYDAYENGLNKLTAKKMLVDKSPAYMAARSAAKELAIILAPIDCDAPAEPTPTDSLQAARIVAPWKRWIEWEKSNPLNVLDKSTVLQQRIQYAYRAALTSLRYYGEIWFEYARWLMSLNKMDDAESTLRDATTILPTDPIVTYAYCDLLEGSESEGKALQAKNVYESLIKSLQPTTTDNTIETTPIEVPNPSINASALTLAWIEYMNYSRRVEGISSARAIFTRARKDANCTYHLFLAAARMELHCKKDVTVAGRIFELGMSKFSTNPEYILSYMQHLLSLNDEQNAAALFERSVPVLGMDGVEVWKCYLDYVFRYADLAATRMLVRRFQEQFPAQPLSHELTVFCRQYSYEELVIAEDRIWINAEVQVPGERIRPFYIPDAIFDLTEQLPATYDGPILNIDAMVRALQVMGTSMGDTSKAAPPVIKKKTTQTIKRKKLRNKLDDGDEREAPKPVSLRENDLFASRYRNK